MSADPPQWHHEVLPEGWAEAADALGARGALEGFHLAGGTGLALRFGHRRSIDLDLFTEHPFDPGALVAGLGGLAGLRDVETAPDTLHLVLGNVRVSFLRYAYPRLFPTQALRGLAVADERDIAAMKLAALANRGSRRDFVDLFIIARAHGLAAVVGWFDRRHVLTPYNRVHLLKSLTYFRDAEREPMPDMLEPISWQTIRNYFISEVPALLG